MSLFFCLPFARCLDPGEQYWVQGLTESKTYNGPGIVCIGPCQPGSKRKATTLTKQQYLVVREYITGSQKIEKGPKLYYLEAYEEIDGGTRNGESLGPTDFMKIIDSQSGKLSIVKGPLLWMPESPYQKSVQKYTAQPLKINEWIKVVDTSSGKIRVEKGEALVYLSETEEFLTPVTQAINIDEHTAVLVRNSNTGQLSLVIEKKLWFPKADEVIEKTQKKIVLEQHQVAILKDMEGRYIFKGGRDVKNKEDRSFFIPPYCEMVTLHWYQSADLEHKGNASEHVNIFDLRPQFLSYKFTCRTCDNVELILDLTFFWELIDIEKMIHKTEDLPGDITSHARGMIIQDVALVTLEKFMAEFAAIIRKAVLGREEDTFYSDRGAKVHSVEVRSIHCKDPNTEKVLQEIIKETTDRLNRLQKQSSENEVRLYKIKGEIEAEKMKADLLRIKHDHKRAEALMEGEARADNVKAFLKGLEGASVPFQTQFEMWESLKKVNALGKLAKTGSQMYFTPNDLNLSMEGGVTTTGIKKVPTKK